MPRWKRWSKLRPIPRPRRIDSSGERHCDASSGAASDISCGAAGRIYPDGTVPLPLTVAAGAAAWPTGCDGCVPVAPTARSCCVPLAWPCSAASAGERVATSVTTTFTSEITRIAAISSQPSAGYNIQQSVYLSNISLLQTLELRLMLTFI